MHLFMAGAIVHGEEGSCMELINTGNDLSIRSLSKNRLTIQLYT
jgi:hypothetical protein